MWRFLDNVSKPDSAKKRKEPDAAEKEILKSKRARVFNNDWLKEFQWLEFTDGEMHCRPCRLYGGDPLSGKSDAGKNTYNIFVYLILKSLITLMLGMNSTFKY
jgi:hypothetical protein